MAGKTTVTAEFTGHSLVKREITKSQFKKNHSVDVPRDLVWPATTNKALRKIDVSDFPKEALDILRAEPEIKVSESTEQPEANSGADSGPKK
jgi:hypothetical protein